MATPRTNFWLRFGTVLTALTAKLAAVTWTPTGGAAELAFQAVAVFDLTDLERALRELLMSADRCALIIHRSNAHATKDRGREIVSSVQREFAIIVTDRDLGNRTASLIGSDTTPGAELLADLVAEQLLGALPVPGVVAAGATRDRGWVEIIESTPMAIEDRTREVLVGRMAMLVRLVVHCGDAQAELGWGHV